jgi:hypothetical protein
MGRSFDRGGQSRKEKSRSKRRAFQQAEREREMRDVLMQARRSDMKAVRATSKVYREPTPAVAAMQAATQPPVTAILDQKRPGFLSRVFGRIFGKAA